MATEIFEALSDEAIPSCYSVLVQLRTHLSQEEFLKKVRVQRSQGYRLACIKDADRVQAVAGFRMHDTFAWGRICYVDDLVTDSAARSRSHGQALFEWLVTKAREEGCNQLHLDSGVQRFAAHRFYLARQMEISCHHFSLAL